MTEYRFLNKYNFWPVPYRFHYEWEDGTKSVSLPRIYTGDAFAGYVNSKKMYPQLWKINEAGTEIRESNNPENSR
jgi:hypothetical protein